MQKGVTFISAQHRVQSRLGVVALFPGFMEWHLVVAAGSVAISRFYYLE